MKQDTRSAPPFPAWRTSGGLIFTSGQIATAPDSKPVPGGLRPVSDDFEVQARTCLDNLFAVLAEAGSSPAQVLRIECFLTDERYLGAWHRTFLEYFPEPRPARSTLIARPPAPGFLIEVQAVAAVAESTT